MGKHSRKPTQVLKTDTKSIKKKSSSSKKKKAAAPTEPFTKGLIAALLRQALVQVQEKYGDTETTCMLTTPFISDARALVTERLIELIHAADKMSMLEKRKTLMRRDVVKALIAQGRTNIPNSSSLVKASFS